MIRIFFHRAKCIGCNACVERDKQRWRVSRKDGKCHLIGATEKKGIYRVEVENEELPFIEQAAKNCPVKIISFEKLK